MEKIIKSFYELAWDSNKNIEKIELEIIWLIEKIIKNDPRVNDELEQKILEIDLKKITKKLEKLWAIKKFSWWIIDDRFDFESEKLKKFDIIFRTRQTSIKDYITIKKKIDNKNISENKEFEVEVDDICQLILDIRNIWLKVIRSKRRVKYRISYTYNWTNFDFDKYDDIPWFLEIEAPSEKDIKKWIKKLDLEEYKRVNFWYKWLKKLYNL